MALPTPEQLVRVGKAIRLSRSQVAEIYDPLAVEKGGEKLRVIQLMAEPGEPPYFAALVQARDSGWFSELVERLLTAGAIPEIDEGTDQAKQMRVDLHGFVQASLGLARADDLHTGFIKAKRRVCRITVQTAEFTSRGTGFLVGPQAIVTSWHVVKLLLDESGAEISNSSASISVEFDQLGGLTDGTMVKVPTQWLVDGSRPHPSETPETALADFDSINSTDFDKCLDYAVIRLAAPLGRQRGFYQLDRGRKPRTQGDRTQITLFQHPGGSSLHVGHGTAKRLWPPIVETRLLHNANSMGGSSGGLVLDADFEPVALHQCGFNDSEGNPIINGAIPTACIAANDKKFDTVIGLDPVWRIAATGEPIIGREAFQAAILNSVAGNKHILVVNGDPKTGRSFSTSILRAVLGNAQHSIVELKAAEISALPLKLATDLLSRVSEPSAGEPSLPVPQDAETAQEAWIRDILFPAFTDHLRKAARGRILWLVIDDLDINPLADSASRHLLEQLYRQIDTLPFLRVVLIGLSGPVPAAAPIQVDRDTTSVFTQDELQTYVERRSVELGVLRSADEARILAIAAITAAKAIAGPQVPNLAHLILEFVEATSQ